LYKGNNVDERKNIKENIDLSSTWTKYTPKDVKQCS